MKAPYITFLALICGIVNLKALDPIADFKTGLVIEAGDKILKWEGDLNGDGKPDVFLSLKSDAEEFRKDEDPPSWDLYLRNQEDTDYVVCNELKEPNGDISGHLPVIDTERCFIGQITELGKKGIVTMRGHIGPREGPTSNIIYAYTVEEGFLKKTELARYEDTATPHALYTKYLADDKRTVITPVEITP